MESQLISIYLAEYDKLKQEQISRIGFRDNLIYVTITAIGGVMSFIVSEKIIIEAILIIPWVCSILGWIYLRNDEKISLIGNYISGDLTLKIKSAISNKKAIQNNLFNWEHAHKELKGNKRKKLYQFFIDLLIFILPSISAISIFVSSYNLRKGISIILLVEVLFIVLLLLEFIFKKYRFDSQ